MMINLGRLKSGDLGYVRDEIKAVAETIAPVPLKVILEVSRSHGRRDSPRQRSCCQWRSCVRQDRDRLDGRATTPHTFGLSTPSCKVSVASKRQEGSEIFETVKAMISVGVARFGINTGVALELMKECALSEAC